MVLKNSNDISLLPWQSTILNWMGGATIVLFIILFLIMTINIFIYPKQKRLQNKIYSIFCFILLIFFLAFVISTAVAISFLVDVELGWKLSLLAGASVILCAISTIMALKGSFGHAWGSEMSSFWIYVWMILGVLSFVNIIALIAASLPYP